MNIKIEKIGDILVINLNELKFTNMFASEFRDKLTATINEGNHKILINLEKVNYMDSAALGSIISVYNHLNESASSNDVETKFAICSLSKSLDFLFSILRINGLIDIYDNKESAIELMKL